MNWWLPRWLDRVTPHLSIEGAEFFEARDQQRPAPQPIAATDAAKS
jgi:hypothetical protein